jgi:hypothetical protein
MQQEMGRVKRFIAATIGPRRKPAKPENTKARAFGRKDAGGEAGQHWEERRPANL